MVSVFRYILQLLGAEKACFLKRVFPILVLKLGEFI